MERLIIQVAVGYMLKVLKAKSKIDFQKEEFAAIRHGNYDQFLNLVNGPIPEMVVYNAGVIKTKNISQVNDFDFAALINVAPSMLIFYEKCRNHFGNIQDSNLKDSDFESVALFEIGLRMHANNHGLINSFEKLESVINKLGSKLRLTKEEIDQLHLGRRFLNMIKHDKKKFETWEIGIKAFQSAMQIIENYKLRVI